MNRTCEVETNLAQYHTARYTVRRDGARTQVDFDGVTCRFFQGGLRITVYDGSNLMRVELITTAQEPSMAYLYRGGLRGFSAEAVSYIAPDRTEVTGEILYGPTDKTVKVRSRGRNLIARLESGVTVAVCPPPHAFFFARQLENIVGYPARFLKIKDVCRGRPGAKNCAAQCRPPAQTGRGLFESAKAQFLWRFFYFASTLALSRSL